VDGDLRLAGRGQHRRLARADAASLFEQDRSAPRILAAVADPRASGPTDLRRAREARDALSLARSTGMIPCAPAGAGAPVQIRTQVPGRNEPRQF
jgi:hypothetical protein